MAIGSEQAFGTRPAYLVSWKPFQANDSHIVNYYGEDVPYHVLDDNPAWPLPPVDVVSSTCPCAGLSQMSHGYGDDNPNNQWMPRAAKYVLEELKPEVYWGENAPGFAGKIGATIRAELRQIGKEAGYSMSVYRTKSLLHGVCQVRERSFYFFWRGDRVPLLRYFARDHDLVEDVILSASGNTQREPINPKTPSKDDCYYRYILEKIHGGISHREFCKIIEPSTARGNDVLTYIERQGHNYIKDVSPWMVEHGYDREVKKCEYRQNKIDAGGNVMRRGTVVPRDFIGAFVGHYPTSLTHPVEDRYINYREAMTIMGLPQNFELLNPKKSANHICQNVPVQTARDMANEVRFALLGQRDWYRSPYMLQSNHSQSEEYELYDGDVNTLEGLYA